MHAWNRIQLWAIAGSLTVGCHSSNAGGSVDASVDLGPDLIDTAPDPDVLDSGVSDLVREDVLTDSAEDPVDIDTADEPDGAEDAAADLPADVPELRDAPADAVDAGQDGDAGRDVEFDPDVSEDRDAVDALPDLEPDVAPDLAPDLPPDPPFPDLTIGPYPSALELLVNSAESLTDAYDSSATYTHVAAQGFVLQAIGHILWAARGYEFSAREMLIAAALVEIDELRASDDRVLSGGPAFGLPDAWDAFGDDTTNPAYTAYTWQSGMAALGVAQIARYLVEVDHPAASEVLSYGVELVDYWDGFYTSNSDGGYFWYSDQAFDAIAVHNTSALVAMASQVLAESGGPERLGLRPESCVDLLWARMSGNPTIGYRWNYADDGFPADRRRAEDISHALVTTQLMRFAADRGWWSRSQMQGVATTLRDTMWTGNPARLNGFVDGSSGGESEWTWSRAAGICYAAHGDADGGDPLVFDMARSILFSTELSRYERGFDGSVAATGILTLALLLSRTPTPFANDTAWRMAAGPEDDAVPATETPGVRFYTVEWDPPADVTAGGLSLRARAASATTANLLIDLPDDYEGRVAVSLTYNSTTSGNVQQWNGVRYDTLAPLPATRDDESTLRWHRTTFELSRDHRFDYQGAPGTNILLQLTGATPTVHLIEASPLD